MSLPFFFFFHSFLEIKILVFTLRPFLGLSHLQRRTAVVVIQEESQWAQRLDMQIVYFAPYFIVTVLPLPVLSEHFFYHFVTYFYAKMQDVLSEWAKRLQYQLLES